MYNNNKITWDSISLLNKLSEIGIGSNNLFTLVQLTILSHKNVIIN